MGRHEEAIAQATCAKELDPLSLIVNTALGAAFYFANRYVEAIEQYKSTLDLDPKFQRAYYWLGFAHLQLAEYKEAIAAFEEAIILSSDSPENRAALGYAYAIAGKHSEAEKILIELKKLSSRRYISPMDIAMIYVGLERKEQSPEWLDKAFKVRTDGIQWLKVHPVFYPLKSNPCFQNLIRQMNIPE